MAGTQREDQAHQWTEEEVAVWLHHIGLGGHAGAFRRQGIDGAALGGMARFMRADARYALELIRTELSIERVGELLRLCEGLHQLLD